MDRTASIREARKHLPHLVDLAERGEGTVITRHGRAAAMLIPITQGVDMTQRTVWRLTLECGHFRLDGPWEDSEPRHMIGDITWCEVCPHVPRLAGSGEEMMVRQVVNVEAVSARQYREPTEVLERVRLDRLHG